MSISVPSNSCCLVTGASDPTSIGYACALSLLQGGAAKVTIMSRSADKVEDAKQRLSLECADLPGEIFGVVGDLKEPTTMTAVVKEAVDLMGGSLTILVINGGNGGSEYLGLDATDPQSYRMMNDVAVLSPMFLTEAAIPELAKASDGGTVVMVTSAAPNVPWPDTAPFNYAKAAQNCMVQTLAFKYRTSGVRVNAVLPACIHTGALDRMAEKKSVPVADYAQLRADAHPMERLGTAEDVANAVLFLASPASRYTTGELLKVDGGLHLSSWFNKPKLLAEYVGGTTTE